MKISGFSFVRNAGLYDFPLVESLRSLLPLCDELIVVVGRSDDDTLEMVTGIGDARIRIIETVWDDSLREGGKILAQQTDIALAACTGAWCIYLQADEVLHEDDTDLILRSIHAADADPRVDALLFRYLHFYGSHDYVGVGRQWYRREVRAIRNTGRVISGGMRRASANFFRDGSATHLRARQTEARIFHYGWVRHSGVQHRKQREFHRLWHDDQWLEEHVPRADEFDYTNIFELRKYSWNAPRSDA